MSNLPTKREDNALQQQPEARPGDLLRAVLREVANPNVDPARLREFLEIGERLEARAAKEAFALARRELQPKLPAIRKNGLISYGVGKGSTPFAKWDDIYRACMPLLTEHGFTCSFSSELQAANALKVTMTVKHTGGAEDTGSLTVPWLDTGGSKSPAQAAASSFSVAERHVFVKYWNILTEDRDDDGSGQGVPERITEEQGQRIEDQVQEFTNRDPNFRRRFMARLKAELHVDSIGQLCQGQQYDTVAKWLREKTR